MPTTRRRLVITETDDVAAVLELAAQRWPEDRDHRRRLLLHLVHEGGRSIEQADESARAAQRRAVERTSGALTGAYRRDELAVLREDWPE